MSSTRASIGCWPLLLSAAAAAHPVYVSEIPNGSAIDGRGCINCHNAPQGGGSRTPFGNAMENADFSWSEVCPSDSDGDGQTNGEELGDPNCVWIGGGAQRLLAISNPGFASSTSADPDGILPGFDAGPGACPINAERVDGGACGCSAGFTANADGVCTLPDGGTGVCPPHSTATHDVFACRCDPGFQPDENPTGNCVPIVVGPDAGVVVGDDSGVPLGLLDGGAHVDGGTVFPGDDAQGDDSCASARPGFSMVAIFTLCAVALARRRRGR